MSMPSNKPFENERAHHAFIGGCGETAALIRSIDWSSSPLGPPENWPRALRTTLAIMLHSRHPMFLWWGPELIQFYNDAYLPSFGEGKHPVAMGQRGEECWPEIWSIIGPQIDDVMQRGIASWHENQLVPIYRDGGIQDVYWTYGYSPVFDDAQEEILGTLVVCQETTAEVAAHAATASSNRESEVARKRLANLFNHAPAFVCTLSGPRHVFETVNTLYQQLIGPNREVLGKPIADALPELVGQSFLELLDSAFHRGEPSIGREERVRLARGQDNLEERCVTFVYQPRRNCEGQVEGIDVFGCDVTDAVRAREAALRATAASHALAEAIPQQVWTSDPSGKIEFVNHRGLEYFGAAQSQVHGRGWAQFVHPDDFEQSLCTWADSLKTGALYESEVRLRAKDGTYRWHLARALPVRDEEQKITQWFGTNTDIDEHKRLRDTLRKQGEFEQHLLGIVSHDLRTPLHVVILGAVALADEPNASPGAVSMLARIQSAARRAERLVGDLLDFTQARLGGGLSMHLRPTILRDVVASVAQEFITTHPERSIWVERHGNDVGMWDPDRLAQVLSNLISNALRYGSLSEPVLVVIREENNSAILEVTNQGLPIPEELMPRLFQPMRRGDNARGERSVGLGLYIVDEIAKRHGGSVAVTSSESGTTFAVRLPRGFEP